MIRSVYFPDQCVSGQVLVGKAYPVGNLCIFGPFLALYFLGILL